MATVLPNYEVVPLRKDEISVGVVQSQVNTVSPQNAERERKNNLNHLLNLVDTAQAWGYKDLLAFHEFPLGGLDMKWSREEVMRVAIEVPGPETAAIGEKASQYHCYIAFGCYAKLQDWPGHFINLGIVIGPDGSIVYQHWKTRNMTAFGFSTTVYDVLDEYVERYGWDAVFPVARTDIGNIGMLPEVLEPELGRAYAIKGAEIMIRYMTAGAGPWNVRPIAFHGGHHENVFINDFKSFCAAGNYYGLFVNNAISSGGHGAEFDIGAGHSTIIDCNGRTLCEVASLSETMISAVIPISAYRKSHSIPHFPKELYSHLYQDYIPKYKPNTFLDNLPDSIQDAAEHYNRLANW
jgi:predicted amidohydrolase